MLIYTVDFHRQACVRGEKVHVSSSLYVRCGAVFTLFLKTHYFSALDALELVFMGSVHLLKH